MKQFEEVNLTVVVIYSPSQAWTITKNCFIKSSIRNKNMVPYYITEFSNLALTEESKEARKTKVVIIKPLTGKLIQFINFRN